MNDEFPPPPQSEPTYVLREAVKTIIQTILFTALIIYFIAQATIVQGSSMEPSLTTDQRLIIEKVSYYLTQPERGDVIVLNIPDVEVPLIKRVIATAGETLQIINNRVFINGIELTEDYLGNIQQRNFGPVTIPTNYVFVMGDNRTVSNDSRMFGAVPVSQVLGKAWVAYWPIDNAGVIR